MVVKYGGRESLLTVLRAQTYKNSKGCPGSLINIRTALKYTSHLSLRPIFLSYIGTDFTLSCNINAHRARRHRLFNFSLSYDPNHRHDDEHPNTFLNHHTSLCRSVLFHPNI